MDPVMDSDGDGHGDNNEASTAPVEESAAKHFPSLVRHSPQEA